MLVGFNVPHLIKRGPEFAEYTGGSKQQSHHTDDERKRAGDRSLGMFDHSLHSFRSLVADHILDLTE
jgi:hypothetical protein